MATLLRNNALEGALPLPAIYGAHLVPAGREVIIADTPANVAAALGNPDSSIVQLDLTADGQAGAISPASTGAAGALSYSPTDPAAHVSPAPANVGSALDKLGLLTKYTLAAVERVHMDADAVIVLPDLLAGDLLATAGAQYTTIKAAMVAHFADGGASPTVDADHKIADAVSGAGLGNAVDTLPHLITRIGEAKAAIIAHGNQAGVHFHDDAGTSGTGFTLSVDPPVTQADCNADINDIKHALNVHFGLASL